MASSAAIVAAYCCISCVHAYVCLLNTNHCDPTAAHDMYCQGAVPLLCIASMPACLSSFVSCTCIYILWLCPTGVCLAECWASLQEGQLSTASVLPTSAHSGPLSGTNTCRSAVARQVDTASKHCRSHMAISNAKVRNHAVSGKRRHVAADVRTCALHFAGRFTNSSQEAVLGLFPRSWR